MTSKGNTNAEQQQRPFVWDTPGEPAPEENIDLLPPIFMATVLCL